ncbi:MAG: biopolymer transporter Tol [Melioribacteraceae bacterium]|nr:biopolymer transporter Tol [Melioribacteraceae bacterium]MCF8263814.1 biopolymer transporter Tol [Melioribacteraceae bacterium]
MKKTILFIFLLSTKLIFAQFNEYYPDYEWLTIKGEFVEVHYHPEAERTARVVAKIADEVWGPITSLYQYEPDLVHFVIKDIDDFSNGATYFFDNKIEIWASALDFDLRGTKDWLRNVITHEFTHLVQIQAGMKLSRSVPAFYLQYLNYEDKRRPDILYGFPNFIASYPVPGVNIPAWFAEGTAQYQRPEFEYENWDAHRDMILRSYVLDGNMLTWNQMGVFSKTSLGNESVYNSGYALTRYIAQKYGEDKLREITQKLGKLTNFTIDAAFKDVLGKDGDEIYSEWAQFLNEDYSSRIANVRENLIVGDTLADKGFGNFYPTYSPDGKSIAYISNKSADYFGIAGIYIKNLETGKEISINERINSSIGFISDSLIVYSKLSEENPNSINIHDLFIYDLKEEEETRITKGLRANSPAVSFDSKKIAFVFQKDGTGNIGIVDTDGKNFKQLTFYSNGEQAFNPTFTPDNNSVVFGFAQTKERDIASINIDGTGFKYVIKTEDDERNPIYNKEGRLYYSSDVTGIFNIYSLDNGDKESNQHTNVIGGAFMPSVREDGTIAYAGYTSGGYKIFSIKNEDQAKVVPGKSYTVTKNPPLDMSKPNGDLTQSTITSLKNFNDGITPDYEVEKYSGSFSKISFFPFIRYDNYNSESSFLEKLKPGVYISSFDMLNRMALFGGASINANMERDLFLIFDYRDKLPLIYGLGLKPELSLELYSISRKADVDIFFGVDSTGGNVSYDYIIPTAVTYNLFEFDIVAKHKIFNSANEIEARFIYSSYTATLSSFILPDSRSTLYPTTNDTYFIGKNIRLLWRHQSYIPNIDRDINPIGRKIELKYDYEFNEFNDKGEYEVEDGLLKPVYNDYKFHKLELNWTEHYETLKNHTLSAQLRVGSILGPEVPDFFDFYLGGLIGMKSYPFYAISGNEIGWLNLTYRMPLFTKIDYRFGHFYLDKIFISVYGDLGNAWNGDVPGFSEFKKGAGAEVRIKLNSFYLFPTSLFFNASYSFDDVTRDVRGETVRYGKEWRFYGGILFDFNI